MVRLALFTVFALVVYTSFPQYLFAASAAKSNIDTTGLNGVDAFDARDVDGDGLEELIVGNESEGSAALYVYDQTTRGNFTEYQIATGDSTGWEGAVWIDVDGDGNYEVIVVDQININGNPAYWLYTPDIEGDYDNTNWSGAAIINGYNSGQDLKAWDSDGDGDEEMLFTNQVDTHGSPNVGGGVNLLGYNTGTLTSSTSYSIYRIADLVDAWWMSEIADLDDDGQEDDLVVAARNNSGRSVGGLYQISAPSDRTASWTKSTITDENEDWLHVHLGNFYGTSLRDVIAQTYAGSVVTFEYKNSWASTTIITNDQTEANWNVLPLTGYATNSREHFVVYGGSESTVNGEFGVWGYNGSTWQQLFANANESGKPDDRVILLDLDGTEPKEVVAVDGVDDALYYHTISNLIYEDNPLLDILLFNRSTIHSVELGNVTITN